MGWEAASTRSTTDLTSQGDLNVAVTLLSTAPWTQEVGRSCPWLTARSVRRTGAATQDHSLAGRARPGVVHSGRSPGTIGEPPERGFLTLRLARFPDARPQVWDERCPRCPTSHVK